jgi:pimeloyl-ACP methyl ester carboxylesterase
MWRRALKSTVLFGVISIMALALPAWSNAARESAGHPAHDKAPSPSGAKPASTHPSATTSVAPVVQAKARKWVMPKPSPFVIASEDGFLLHSNVYYPAGKTKRLPVVMLLHNLDGTQKDWRPLIPAITAKGYAVVTMDLRGHGQSAARGKSPKKKPKRFTSWRVMTTEELQKMPSDVTQVLRHMAGHPEVFPRLNSKKVAIIGGSVGANAAMLAGHTYQHRVVGVGLLSARLKYKGLEISVATVYYPGSVFIAASQSDPQPFESAKRLFQLSQGKKSIRLFKDAGQGTDLLLGYPPIIDDLTSWLDKVFLGESSHKEPTDMGLQPS